MTGYDPFAADQASPPAEPKTSPSPDDMLFADAIGAARNAPPADSSWGLIDADVDSLLPSSRNLPGGGVDFGNDVLGEALPVSPQPAPAVRPRPSATPRPAAPAGAQKQAIGPRALEAPKREVGTKPVASGAPAGTAPARDSGAVPPAYLARKPSSIGRAGKLKLASVLVPAALFIGGGVTAAWLFEAQQNTMMAAIAMALTLVATVFTRLLLRA